MDFLRNRVTSAMLLLTLMVSCSACKSQESSVDVFYIVSTDVLSARNESGGVSWYATLCEEDCTQMDKEIAWVKENMFYDDFNVVAPYYHQYTFEAVCNLSTDSLMSVCDSVNREVCGLFDEFMANRDCSRPFILAGFSQGAMVALDILRNMTDEQYACTCINPVNWRTDSKRACFEYDGFLHQVHVDTSYNVLIVESEPGRFTTTLLTV